MHHKISRSLKRFANGVVIGRALWQRANIILDAIKGITNGEIALLYNVSRNVIGKQHTLRRKRRTSLC